MNVTYDSDQKRIILWDDLIEIYRYRHFLSNLISRDLSVRYKRTALGFIWSFLNPLLMMIVLSIAFSNVLGREEARSTYILSGILIFGLFNQGVAAGMGSIISNANIITTIYVPNSIFIISAIISEFINFLFSIIVFFGIGIALGTKIALSWLYLPYISILIFLFTLGTGFIISGLAIFFMDIRDIWRILMRAFYFLTPVLLTYDRFPEPLQKFQNFNPISIYMTHFRTAFYGDPLTMSDLGLMTTIAFVTLIIGWIIFNQLSKWIPYYL